MKKKFILNILNFKLFSRKYLINENANKNFNEQAQKNKNINIYTTHCDDDDDDDYDIDGEDEQYWEKVFKSDDFTVWIFNSMFNFVH